MAAHRNPVKRQQKRVPTRPFFLTGVWNSSYCLQKPAFILSPVLPDQFLFRLLLKMLRQWFCFFLFLPNQRGIIPHCVIRAASPIEQVFFPGQCSFPPSTIPVSVFPVYQPCRKNPLADMGKLQPVPLISVELLIRPFPPSRPSGLS